MNLFEIILQILMLLSVAAMVFSRNLTRSLLWLSVFSLLLTVRYFTLNAPDVAITEAALGTGVTTIVFLTAIRRTRSGAAKTKRGHPHDQPA